MFRNQERYPRHGSGANAGWQQAFKERAPRHLPRMLLQDGRWSFTGKVPASWRRRRLAKKSFVIIYLERSSGQDRRINYSGEAFRVSGKEESCHNGPGKEESQQRMPRHLPRMLLQENEGLTQVKHQVSWRRKKITAKPFVSLYLHFQDRERS